MRHLSICCSSLLLMATTAHADCVAQSHARAHLLELYTSEGCSSCPPADQWFSALPADTARIALAFHVDYWDSLGWKDRFADPRFTQRQQAVAAHSHSATVYTPEVALDGHEWRNWSRGEAPPSSAGEAPTLSLHVVPASPLQLRLDARASANGDLADYVAYFALSEDGLTSAVRQGENQGRELHHDHVVRAFAGPFALNQAKAELTLPRDARRDNTSVVAFVQRRDGGDVVNVVRANLTQCDAESRP